MGLFRKFISEIIPWDYFRENTVIKLIEKTVLTQIFHGLPQI
jgi:hypothetical protein